MGNTRDNILTVAKLMGGIVTDTNIVLLRDLVKDLDKDIIVHFRSVDYAYGDEPKWQDNQVSVETVMNDAHYENYKVDRYDCIIHSDNVEVFE